MTIELLKKPNQVVNFTTDEHEFIVNIRMFRGLVFASVSVDRGIVVGSRRVVLNDNILGYDYLKDKYGTLMFVMKYDSDITNYKAFNSAIYLDYKLPS